MIRLQLGGTNGQLILSPGLSGSLGYVQFINTAGTQAGYVGYGQALANYIDLSTQNGYLGYRANGNLIVANQLAVGANTINSGTALTVTGNAVTTGNVGIGTVYSSTYNLNVYGVSYFEPKQGGYPGGGAIGSDGMSIVIYPGASSSQAMALGFGAYQLWYNTPSGNYHSFYVGGTQILTISSAGLATTGVSYISASSPNSGNNYLDVGGTSTSTFYSYLNGLRISGVDANTLYLPPGVGFSSNMTLTVGDTTKTLKLSVGNGNILVSVANTGTTMYNNTSINSLGVGTAADGTAGDLTVNNNINANSFDRAAGINQIVTKVIGINPISSTGGPANTGYWLIDISRYQSQLGFTYLFLNISQNAGTPIYWVGRMVLTPGLYDIYYPDYSSNITLHYTTSGGSFIQVYSPSTTASGLLYYKIIG